MKYPNLARLLLLVAAFVFGPVIGRAADEKTTTDKNSGVIILKLKDFKFKPPKAVSNPDDVFVYDENEERLCFYTNGPAEAKFKVRTDGEYDIIVTASGDSAMNIRPKFKLTVDEKDVGKEISLKSDGVKAYRAPVNLKTGEHVLSVAFTNDTYKEGEYDSNLYILGME
jgi:hypothetical protein